MQKNVKVVFNLTTTDNNYEYLGVYSSNTFLWISIFFPIKLGYIHYLSVISFVTDGKCILNRLKLKKLGGAGGEEELFPGSQEYYSFRYD